MLAVLYEKQTHNHWGLVVVEVFEIATVSTQVTRATDPCPVHETLRCHICGLMQPSMQAQDEDNISFHLDDYQDRTTLVCAQSKLSSVDKC